MPGFWINSKCPNINIFEHSSFLPHYILNHSQFCRSKPTAEISLCAPTPTSFVHSCCNPNSLAALLTLAMLALHSSNVFMPVLNTMRYYQCLRSFETILFPYRKVLRCTVDSTIPLYPLVKGRMTQHPVVYMLSLSKKKWSSFRMYKSQSLHHTPTSWLQ